MSNSGRSEGASISILRCGHQYGTQMVLRDISLEVKGGELVTLLGQSGSGKTTLLRILAGLTRPSRGDIFVGGENITEAPAERRNFGMVFQNYALFPHLTVADNIAFPLKVRRMSSKAVHERVAEMLDLVGLGSFGERYPAQLSGGQQQRVAIARALAFRPRLLLMDEPLGALDRRLRQQLQFELRRLQSSLGITTVYVTHDQEEAFAISDRIAVMDAGRILQFAPPLEIYRCPESQFVADFVGELNTYHGVIDRSGPSALVQTRAGGAISISSDLADGTAVVCGVRPERIVVDPGHGENNFDARIEDIKFIGAEHRIEVTLPQGATALIKRQEGLGLRQGDTIRIGWEARDVHVFPA